MVSGRSYSNSAKPLSVPAHGGVMAFPRLSSGDVAGFKVLFALLTLYAAISYLAYSAIHMNFIAPLGADAPLDRFSEARAIEHVRVLAEDIGGRQVS